MSVKQKLFVSVFVHKCLMILNHVEYNTTFKMFVTQMSNYLYVFFFFSINVLLIYGYNHLITMYTLPPS